jgi:6-phosphogluconolactonase
VKVEIYDTADGLARAAARRFVERAEGSQRFTVALAGGSTPRTAYELLATEYADRLFWSHTHVFFGDERPVPPDHPDSNHRMAEEAMLSYVIPASVHRMQGEIPPEKAAATYEKELREFFAGPPLFDLVLLGLGPDGHTASLFPRSPALEETERYAVANPVEKLATERLTLTLPVINAAREIVFLVSGEDKAEAVAEVLRGETEPRKYPAKLVKPREDSLWLLDRAAAELL